MLTSKYKRIVGLLCLLLLAVLVDQSLLALQSAHAQGVTIVPGNGITSAGSLGDVLKDVMVKVAAVNTFMHVLLLLALQFVGYFLQADFFNDPSMMSALFTIWQLSRNIMNVIFALMLIGVSFYVIISAKTDMIKEKLVQFVIAVVLVNMSWFFPRVILDVANVLTATIFATPNLLPTPDCSMLDINNNPVPCKVITAVQLFGSQQDPESRAFCDAHAGGAAPGSPSCPCVDGIECHVEKNYDDALSSGGMAPAHAMINGLAVSFARISQLAKIPTTISGTGPLGASQSVKVSMQIAMSILMAFIIQLALVLPLLGLAVGLLIRIIVIWVTTAFMPFVFIGYVVNGKLGTDVFGFETDIWKEFINAAFLPAVIGIPMTIGFIMLSTVSTITVPTSMPFTMTVPIISGVRTWWALIWMFAAIGIIWQGTFAALSKSKITAKFTDKIKAFGETVAGGVAQLPLLTPIPLPGLKNSNLGTLVHGPKLLADTVRFQASGAATGSFGDNLKRRFGGGTANNANQNGLNNGSKTPEEIAREIDAGKQNADRIVQALERLNRANNETERKAAVVEIQREVGGTNGLDALQRAQGIVGNIQDVNNKLRQVTVDFNKQIAAERASNNPPNNP